MTEEQAIWIAKRYSQRYDCDVDYLSAEAFLIDEAGRERTGQAWHVRFSYQIPENIVTSHPYLFIEIEVLTGEVIQRECAYCMYLGNYLADKWLQGSKPW